MLVAMECPHCSAGSDKPGHYSTRQFDLKARQLVHDLSNALLVISGTLEILTQHDEGTVEKRELCGIRDIADHAADLCKRLATVNLEREEPRDRIDVNQLIASVAACLQPVLGRFIDVVFEPQEKSAPVRANKVQLERVLINLFVNARDAMSGFGRIHVRTTQQLADSSGTTFVRIDIADNGPGMDSTTKQRLFEPFFTTKKKAEGSGLGMPTCAAIVADHGGQILVDSRPAAGTTIAVLLPRV